MSPLLTLLLGSITAVSICLPCLADLPVPSASTGSAWTEGPETRALGSIGEISFPSGYKFLDSQKASAYLDEHKQFKPANLLGILSPDSGDWWAVLQFSDQGYSRNPEAETLNAADILKTLSAATTSQPQGKTAAGAATTPSVTWEEAPHYEAQTHTLQWALRTENATGPVMVQTVRLLCRHGSVDATLVKPYGNFRSLAPLDMLMKNVTLHAGERYADYQAGDKVCSLPLAALVKNTDVAAKSTLAAASDSNSTSLLSNTPLLAGGGAACLVVLGGIGFYVRGSRRKTQPNRAPERETAPTLPPAPKPEPARPKLINTPAPAPATPQPAVARPALKPAPANRPLAAKLQPRTEVLRKPLNGKTNGQHRRKVFDYNRYFTDLMGAVSSHGSQMETSVTNGVPVDGTQFPLPANGAGGAAPASSSTVEQHAELLASQRELIAEQKRLIQEQNKLIEEKTRLIAEKNELLKLQNQLIDDKLV